MDKQDVIGAIVSYAMDHHPPKSQYDCCLLGARCSIAVGDIPRSDEEFIEAAYGQAKGLFGPAFAAADYAQKSAWVDMCERALREAAGAERI
jgi:hypothetical protein